MLSLRRVGVVGAAPGCRASRSVVAINDTDHGTIGSGNHEESTGNNDEEAPEDHGHPPGGLGLLALGPVVVEPHGAHGLEADEGAEEGTDEGNETAEDGDGTRDDVGDTGDAARAADPCHPVDLRVAGKVSSATEESNEEVLCGELMKES